MENIPIGKSPWTVEAEKIRDRIRQISPGGPITYDQAYMIIQCMTFGGELDADWFLRTNSEVQLLQAQGYVR